MSQAKPLKSIPQAFLLAEDRLIQVALYIACQIPCIKEEYEYYSGEKVDDVNIRMHTSSSKEKEDEFICDIKVPPNFLEIIIDYMRNKYSISWLRDQFSKYWDDRSQIVEWILKLGFDAYGMGLYEHERPLPHRVGGRTVIVNTEEITFHTHSRSGCGNWDANKKSNVFVLSDGSYLSYEAGLRESNTVHHVRAKKLVIDGKLKCYIVRHPEYSNSLDIPSDELIFENDQCFMHMENYLKHDFYGTHVLKDLFDTGKYFDEEIEKIKISKSNK